MANKVHSILWSSKVTGSDETRFVGTLRDAHRSARKLIGQPVFIDGVEVSTVDWAYVADDNGNPL